jgi:hypothetical protein
MRALVDMAPAWFLVGSISAKEEIRARKRGQGPEKGTR